MVEKTRLSFQQFTYIQRGNICGGFFAFQIQLNRLLKSKEFW